MRNLYAGDDILTKKWQACVKNTNNRMHGWISHNKINPVFYYLFSISTLVISCYSSWKPDLIFNFINLV